MVDKNKKREMNEMFENNKKTGLEALEAVKIGMKNWPFIFLMMAVVVAFVGYENSYTTNTAALKADLKIGLSSQDKELTWLEKAKMNSKSDTTKENPFVVHDGETLLLYFGNSVSEKPVYMWNFDLDGDDGIFSFPLIGGAEPWLWAIAEYDYYYNRAGTIKNADSSITVPLVLRIENDGKFSEDRVFMKILPS